MSDLEKSTPSPFLLPKYSKYINYIAIRIEFKKTFGQALTLIHVLAARAHPYGHSFAFHFEILHA